MADIIAKYQETYKSIMSLYDKRIDRYGYAEQRAFDLAAAALDGLKEVAIHDSEMSVADFDDYILGMDIIRRTEV